MKLVDLSHVTLTGLFICALNVRGEQGSKNVEKRVDDILSQMTFDEIYDILVGASSQDIRLNGQFELRSELASKP